MHLRSVVNINPLKSIVVTLLLGIPVMAQESGRPVSIWVQPLPTLVLGAWTWQMASPVVTISGGVNVPVGNTTLGAEVAVLTMPHPWEPYWQLLASAGPVLMWTGDQGRSGFFVQPRLQLIVSHESAISHYDYPTGRQPEGASLEAQAVADVGYQYISGHLFLSWGIGAGAGACFNCGDTQKPTTWIGPYLWGRSGRRDTHFTWSVDLNLMKVGFNF